MPPSSPSESRHPAAPSARLTRAVRFSAAHRYHRPDWTAEENVRVFGRCAREHGHGHNYTCLVTVEGPLDAQTSMVMNLDSLDALLREHVIEPLDHRHLNHDVPEFAYGKVVPTAEALAIYVWNRLSERLPAEVELIRVRIEEAPDLYADYFGS